MLTPELEQRVRAAGLDPETAGPRIYDIATKHGLAVEKVIEIVERYKRIKDEREALRLDVEAIDAAHVLGCSAAARDAMDSAAPTFEQAGAAAEGKTVGQKLSRNKQAGQTNTDG